MSYKEPLYKEPTCRMLKYLKDLYYRRKIPEEFMNLANFHNSKQARIRKMVPFICSQIQHRLFAMLVSSVL